MKTESDFYALLDDLGIGHKTLEHPPCSGAADSIGAARDGLEFPVKNLFLRDKKKNTYHVVMHLDTPSVDLKVLGEKVGARGRLSFGSADRLMEMLGVAPGSVTPFAQINDPDHKTQLFLDARMQSISSMSAHPLRNDKTTTLSKSDFDKFLSALGKMPTYIDIPLQG